MADLKISALTSATMPLAGNEVLPIVQSGTTKKVASDDLTVKNVRSNATTGVLQVAGPAASTTRVMTVPNANFTAARTDAAQTFTGKQTFSSDLEVNGVAVGRGGSTTLDTNSALGALALNANSTGSQNVAVGKFALLTNTTDDNTGIGFAALYSTASGNQNTAIGSTSLFNATGAKNTAVGVNAGLNLTTGSNCAFFGYNAQPSAVGVSNEYTYGDSNVTQHRLVGGNLVIGTAAKGIDFSANTPAAGMTSQLLNDYEEGNWTPTLNATGFSGATYATQNGTYTRVGRLVTVSCNVELSALTNGGSNYLRIEGLPFTCAVTGSSGTVYSTNLTGGSSGNYIVGYIGNGQTIITFFEMGPDGSINGNGMQGTRLTATSQFILTATYSV